MHNCERGKLGAKSIGVYEKQNIDGINVRKEKLLSMLSFPKLKHLSL